MTHYGLYHLCLPYLIKPFESEAKAINWAYGHGYKFDGEIKEKWLTDGSDGISLQHQQKET